MALMAELDFANALTDSKIRGICKNILQSVDDWAGSKSTTYEQKPKPRAHGFIRPKTALNKGANCHLCDLFLSLFSEAEIRELEHDKLRVESLLSSYGSLLDLLIGWKCLSVLPTTTEQSFGILDRGKWHSPNSSSWSTETLQLANRWLDNCAMEHEECSKDNRPDFLPSRLINIGLDDTIAPRLINTYLRRPSQRYVTLNHYLGGQVPLLLRQDSLAGMRNGILYKGLPKTFQHALLVTQQLKCRYI